MTKKLNVTQVKSVIGSKPKLRATMRALGLRRMNSSRLHDDTPVVRGMLQVVRHLVKVTEVEK